MTARQSGAIKPTTQGTIDWPASNRNAGRNEIGTGGRLRFGINGRLHRNTHCIGWKEIKPFIEQFVIGTPGELDGTKILEFQRKEAAGEFVYLVFENDQMKGTETYVVRNGKIVFESSTIYAK